ncbi:N-acetyltransferase [Jannaschia pagri]|uniref:N-acetyltransferase n=1 Tax=Jannaschia pagri TaxID=2829797 RepID=A0ABQ4NKT2_9RHOB|nr:MULTISPECIES: GNAT family N-acetyltransferase [unclassified Jannaschia]GIT91199.1 N-acetyltransferase [Jannaschia sp. AI_61]GIT95031.1 N-acetyltransferase [Jannaschia sp. AI_62]
MIGPCTIPTTPAAVAQAAALEALVPKLRTPRTTLRAPRLSDFEALHGITGSDRNAFEGGPSTPEETWTDFCGMTATWILRGHGLWTVDTYGGDVAGFVLIGTEPGDEEHELGWLLCAPYEGMGLATEAAMAARTHAQKTLNLPSLVSYIAPGNARSEAVAQRLGAVPDGTILNDQVTIWRHWGTAQ